MCRAAVVLLILLGAAAPRLTAQSNQCGTVQSIQYPVDPQVYTIAQGFGVSSPRHQGRYHTGEDWHGERGLTLGQPVTAIAAGRVTFSNPTAWGADGGVLIIEHTFPDGSVAYSMTGHLFETSDYRFPAVYTCVAAGDVIGTIGDVRPAPHVHLEIRTADPLTPGAGYTWAAPTGVGLVEPSKFITNWRLWLERAHRWHITLRRDDVPFAPVVLNDETLLVYDSDRVVRVSPDGRILWRVLVDRPAVGLLTADGGALLVYTDGTMQPISSESSVGESWSVGVAVTGRLFQPPQGGNALVQTADGLALVDLTAQRIVWTAAVADAQTVTFAPSQFAVVTPSALHVLGADGAPITSAQVRAGASVAGTPDGALLALTNGGLWRVDAAGGWTLYAPDVRGGHALAALPDGVAFYDGTALVRLDTSGAALWTAALPPIGGATHLTAYGDVLVLTSTDGSLLAVQTATGGVCGVVRLWGGAHGFWQRLGSDGILRAALGDQLVALDWQRLLGACAG